MSSFDRSDVVVMSWVRIEDGAEIEYRVARDGTHVEFSLGGRQDFDLVAEVGALRELVSKGAEALQQAEQAQARSCGDEDEDELA